ncbi:hypothetical protein PVAND_012307 [Polypedilum vanderplanki]|uniref:Uncharacterized protein n=1 Tax=Polypedilum vanderplanki TaxID=319348 RepID=A0A9J6CMY9_POLVA|nr:hypothetical protein PVAND_012307 [Polypedilum vanderplanki]
MKFQKFILLAIFIGLIFVNFIDAKPTPQPQFPFTVTTTKRPLGDRPRPPPNIFYDFIGTVVILIKRLWLSFKQKSIYAGNVVYDQPYYPFSTYDSSIVYAK